MLSTISGSEFSRQSVIGGLVDHLELFHDHVAEADLLVELRVRILLRIGRVDAVDARGLDDDVGLDLDGAQHRSGVGREVRIARAGGEDDDAPLLEWRSARRRMYGSAISSMRIAVMTRVSMPFRSRTSCTASALITVPSMPM